MATDLQHYFSAFQSNQKRLLAAQSECWRSWCQLPSSTAGEKRLIDQLDAPMMSSASVLQASSDAQHDMLLMVERWFGEQQKVWESHAILPSSLPVMLGLSGYIIASRASRQIQHFASTRFSYATVSAVRGAQLAYRKCRNDALILPHTPFL